MDEAKKNVPAVDEREQYRIRELRRQKGLTQKQLAEAVGVKYPSIVYAWERGTRNPKGTMLPRLAEVLGCTVDQLYTNGKAPETDADDTDKEYANVEACINYIRKLPPGAQKTFLDMLRGGVIVCGQMLQTVKSGEG